MNSLDDIDPALLPDDEEIIIDEADDNPFEDAQLVICALDFLTDNPTRYQQALDAGWDMLLVDEAHHLAWSEEAPSAAYQCIEGLAREVQRSEEHTSELQSRGHLVCRLLLEKKRT